jgi:hypothetical protein
MQEFNLQAALKGSPISLRNGKSVEQLTYFKNATDKYVVYGVVEDEIMCWTINGVFNVYEGESRFDLVMREEYVDFEEVQE